MHWLTHFIWWIISWETLYAQCSTGLYRFSGKTRRHAPCPYGTSNEIHDKQVNKELNNYIIKECHEGNREGLWLRIIGEVVILRQGVLSRRWVRLRPKKIRSQMWQAPLVPYLIFSLFFFILFRAMMYPAENTQPQFCLGSQHSVPS